MTIAENLTKVRENIARAAKDAGLDEREKDRLNRYHARVYREIAPLLPPEEAAWLKTATRPI